MALAKDRVLTVRVDAALAEAIRKMESTYGTRASDQVRKALEEFLAKHGVMKTARPRARTRERA